MVSTIKGTAKKAKLKNITGSVNWQELTYQLIAKDWRTLSCFLMKEMIPIISFTCTVFDP
jgi:hypothetical protein